MGKTNASSFMKTPRCKLAGVQLQGMHTRVAVSILYYSLHHQVQGPHSKAPRALHLLSRLAGPNRDVRVSEAARVGQVFNLCIQAMTQLDDDICIRGESACCWYWLTATL